MRTLILLLSVLTTLGPGAVPTHAQPAPAGAAAIVAPPQDRQAGAATALAVAPGGKRFAVGFADGTIQIHETQTGKLLATVEAHQDAVMAVTFGATGKLISGDADGTIRVGDGSGDDGAKRPTMHRDTGALFNSNDGRQPVTAMAFSHDGRLVAQARGDKDPPVIVRNVYTGKVVYKLPGHDKTVTGFGFSPDDKYVMSCSKDMRAKLWLPARSRQPLFWELSISKTDTPTQPYFLSVAFAPDGRSAIASYWGEYGDGCFAWPHPVPNELKTYELSHARAITYSPDRKTFASAGDDGVVRIWPYEPLETVKELRGEKQRINDLAYTPDGKRLISADKTGRVVVWDVSDVKVEDEK